MNPLDKRRLFNNCNCALTIITLLFMAGIAAETGYFIAVPVLIILGLILAACS